MKEDMRLYWETYNEYYPNDLILHKYPNPLRNFEKEFIDGPILDIGCGQSNILLEYSITGKEIFAIDNDNYQLKTLKKRIDDYAVDRKGKLNFLNLTLPEDELPSEIFSLIVMSNFLQFFTIDECHNIVKQLIDRTTNGSLVYIVVHSHKHHYNEPKNRKENIRYFKHFFTEEDLNQIFDNSHFERLHFADTQTLFSEFDKEIMRVWTEKILNYYKITNKKERRDALNDTLGDNRVASLVCIYRRK